MQLASQINKNNKKPKNYNKNNFSQNLILILLTKNKYLANYQVN